LLDGLRPSVLPRVDGGVHRGTIDELAAAGVDIFVAGSAVFANGAYTENIKILKDRMTVR
jgi:ribulose-phosphate 3-epimerase